MQSQEDTDRNKISNCVSCKRYHHPSKQLSSSSYYPIPELSLENVEKRLRSSRVASAKEELITEEELALRIQLAAMYRIFGKFGWTDLILNHIVARLPGTTQFYTNSYGLMHKEVTASSLIKIDYKTNEVVDGGIAGDIMEPNKRGFILHSAILEARPDINCVAHCHQSDVIAVACDKRGLVISNQQAQQLGEVTYHDYEGFVISDEEKKRIVNDLGKESKVMILRNHGCVTCGATMGEALVLMHYLIDACKIQCKQGPSCDLIVPDKSIAKETHKIAQSFNKEGVGAKELSAMMRDLDREDPTYRR